jgi:hypothetical protein
MSNQFKIANYLQNMGMVRFPYNSKKYKKIGIPGNHFFYFVSENAVKFGKNTKTTKDVTAKICENAAKWEERL